MLYLGLWYILNQFLYIQTIFNLFELIISKETTSSSLSHSSLYNLMKVPWAFLSPVSALVYLAWNHLPLNSLPGCLQRFQFMLLFQKNKNFWPSKPKLHSHVLMFYLTSYFSLQKLFIYIRIIILYSLSSMIECKFLEERYHSLLNTQLYPQQLGSSPAQS